MKQLKLLLLIFLSINIISCSKDKNTGPIGITLNNSVPIRATNLINFETDKAVYLPNATVNFTIDSSAPANAKVRYKYLNETIQEIDAPGKSWSWQVPSADFKGYMVEIYNIENDKEVIYGTIGLDVSSDWKKFPRYGFLSKFSELSDQQMNTVINNLTRYHINGLQFYDWTEKHHKPLAGTVANPADEWVDIAYRPTCKATIEGYINKAHQKGMKTMSYNLCYGALNDASGDGVQNEWYMFDDINHNHKTVLDIGSFLKSPIYLTDASNTNWQQYLAKRNSDMYAVYNFDGFHIDQLGDWGTKYTYNGQPINITSTYGSFIESMKNAHPDKNLVMNAVNQYGQEGNIGNSATDFLYTEVWSPNENYADLASIIQNNNQYSSNNKNTVLAAYINYDLAENTGSFNINSILFADAVIFAFGGAHIELGEHMLGKEYFPNSNLQMSQELKQSLISYYDFAVAYQNLLRVGGTFNSPALQSSNSKVPINNWPPQTGSVSVIGKSIDNRQVLHLINFKTNSLDWRDPNGTKSTPNTIPNIEVTYTTTQNVKKVWFASPDLVFGKAFELDFHQVGNQIKFIIPTLKYWDMIVIE